VGRRLGWPGVTRVLPGARPVWGSSLVVLSCEDQWMTLTEARKVVHLVLDNSSSFCTECAYETLPARFQIEFPAFDWALMFSEAERGIDLHTLRPPSAG
jgi:hypothetical protein